MLAVAFIAPVLSGDPAAVAVSSPARSGGASTGSLDGVEPTAVDPAEPGTTNAALPRLPTGVWHKIQVEKGLRRRAHGGAAFDTRRGRVVLFGSDTHSQDWDNSVRFFDVAALSWSQAYPADGPSTYRVNGDGIPVAGHGAERPWAMHTFDAVEYDPLRDRLIVASYPKHLSPRKAWGVDDRLWRQIRRHPTWTYSLADGRWSALPGAAEHFFPYAATFDTQRNRFVGVRSDGLYTLGGTPPVWGRIAGGAPEGWHTSAAYDSDRDIVVLYGNNRREDSVWQYRFGEGQGMAMPTTGDRPPGGASVPLVYHPGVQRVVALVTNPTGNATETWLYATADDRWSRIRSADLPFDIRMNYQMVYDPRHDLLWLVANGRGDPVAVWALRLSRRVP